MFYWCISLVISLMLYLSKNLPFIKKIFDKKEIELVNFNEENNIINNNLEER